MKIEKINYIPNARASDAHLLSPLASTRAEAISLNGSKATWRKFDAEAPRNIQNQIVGNLDEQEWKEIIEKSLEKLMADFDGSRHPVFKSESEIQEILKSLEEISDQNPSTTLEFAKLAESYQLRRDLHLRLGDLKEAVYDEQKSAHFESLFLEQFAKELHERLGDRYEVDHEIEKWEMGSNKFREGLSQLVLASLTSGDKEKGIEALTEAAQAGIPNALLILKALNQPLPQSYPSYINPEDEQPGDQWLAKALADDYEGSLKDLETIYDECSCCDPNALINAALVYYLNGDKLRASACLLEARSAWKLNSNPIMPTLQGVLNSGMFAAEIQALFDL